MQQLNQQNFSRKRIGIEKSWDPTEDCEKKSKKEDQHFQRKEDFQ